MEPSLLLMICVIALGLALVLAIWLIRLRMELWANRRAPAILEKTERKPTKQERSRMPEWLLLSLFLLVLWQLLS